MNKYADWKAPKTDQENLIWPAVDTIVAQTRDNAERLGKADHVLIQNASISKLRHQTRHDVGLADSPVIATGHQIEMYHPGVWVKNVLVDSVAKAVGGEGVHVAVETDTPKHLTLRWPGESFAMSDDPSIVTSEWAGAVRSPSDGYRKSVMDRFREDAAQWSFTPAGGPFLDSIESSKASRLSDLITEGARALDQSLGLNVPFLPVARLLETDGYLAFVHHLICDIERFADHYNRALADYRQDAGINSTSRPMPDLRVAGEHIELPFWLDDLSAGTRVRAGAIKRGGHWRLDLPHDAVFAFDPKLDAHAAASKLRAFLKDHQLRLAPRALTLTMFMRLLLVDQFVHGIGGARYDQVTDRIVQSYFKIDPPAFSVTTATLYFPDAGERQSDCIPCLVSEGHHLRHNLDPAKPSYLQKINAAPRNSMARKLHYLAMHRHLEQTIATTDLMSKWKDRLTAATEREEAEKVLFDRELFYGLQSRSRLTAMIERYRI